MQTARFAAALTLALLINLSPSEAQGQAKFEVASVKANTSGSQDFSVDITPEGRVSAHNYTVWNLIRWVSPRTIKETFAPPTSWRYPFLSSE